MKKLLFLVIVLIFMGCSNTQINKNQKNDIAISKQYLDNWKLSDLEYKIQEIHTYNKELADELNKDLLAKNQAKKDLETLLNKIEVSIKTHRIDRIEKDFANTIKNRELIKILKENDFSYYKIIIGKPKFYKNTASNVIGLVYLDQVMYLSVEYKLKESKWRIEGWRVENF